MGEPLESFLHISRHILCDMTSVVTPIQCDATKFCRLHVFCNIVVPSEGSSQMVQVVQGGVLDEKIVHGQCESDGVIMMLEKSRGVSLLPLPCYLESRNKGITGHFPCLG
jgi:hypothetical protein